jgi:hypothetical protein
MRMGSLREGANGNNHHETSYVGYALSVSPQASQLDEVLLLRLVNMLRQKFS